MDEKLTPQEIEKILDDFDKFMEAAVKRAPFLRPRCVICNHPAHREFNRGILERTLTDAELARMLDLYPSVARNHRRICLTKRGGAPLSAVERLALRRRLKFPTQGRPWSTKKWILDELLFLREAEIAKPKPDHKYILKLAKDIDAASDALHAARDKGREERRTKTRAAKDEDFTAEQKIEMAKVNGGGTRST